MGYVYGLIDPQSQKLRYVGKTIGELNLRFNHHIWNAIHGKSTTHKNIWIRSVLRKNLKPEIFDIETIENEQELLDAEVFWIAYFKYIGCDLVNHTIGGDRGSGYKHTDEDKQKMSILKKNKPAYHLRGRKQPLERKLQISRTKTGLTKDKQKEIVLRYNSGVDSRKVAREFGVSQTCVLGLIHL